jgi:hypothetical protein
LRISLSTSVERPDPVALLGTDVSVKSLVVTTRQYRRAKKARIGCGQVKELIMTLKENECKSVLWLSNFMERR